MLVSVILLSPAWFVPSQPPLIDPESFSLEVQLWPSDTTTLGPKREPSVKLPLCPHLYFLHVFLRVWGWWWVFVGGGVVVLALTTDWLFSLGPWRQCQGEVNQTISTCKSIPRDPRALAPSPPPLPPRAKHPFRGGPLCPCSPLSPLQRGAVQRRKGATVLLISFFDCHCFQGQLPLRSRWV